METLLPLLLFISLPFKTENNDFLLIYFLGGILVDLMYGSLIGSTSLFAVVVWASLLFFSRATRFRIRIKLAIALVICFIYFYVLRRFFF